jgi:hypothetical protein
MKHGLTPCPRVSAATRTLGEPVTYLNVGKGTNFLDTVQEWSMVGARVEVERFN